MLNIFYEHILEGCAQCSIDTGRGLQRASNYGIQGLECDVKRLHDHEIKHLFDDNGMTVRSVYHTFAFESATDEQIRNEYMDLFDTAAFFGAGKVLVVPGFNVENERTAEQLDRICSDAVQYGIQVGIEDYDDIHSPCCRSDDIAYLLDNVPALGFVFDTGNWAYALEDEISSFRRFESRIMHVHLKDRTRTVQGERKDDMAGCPMYPCPFGSGFIRSREILYALKAKGYDGDLSIEHFGSNDQFAYMKSSAVFIKENY